MMCPNIFTFMFLTIVVMAIRAQESEETYETDHDDLDIEALVADKEQFNSFIDCFTDAASCSDLAAAFKAKIPEAIVEACAKCTPAQKHIVKVLIDAFRTKMPQEYEKFQDKFDPERKYFPNLEASVASY